MSIVKSYAVGNGDMYYIKHNSDNFTIIDCQLFGDHKEWLVEELKQEAKYKGIERFISTHPDEDHFQGIEYLDEKMPISNFYVVENSAIKSDETDSFKHYRSLRDGNKAFYLSKGCKRRWMNDSDKVRDTSGIQILWPNLDNKHFKSALQDAENGTAYNNISLVARYSVEDSASFLWLGDLETTFMENILDDIALSKTTVVFAPHHGRESGKLPHTWLDKLQPKIIVLGEAPSRHLNYYTGYKTLIQNSAKDITFDVVEGKLHCYSSDKNYGKRDWLTDEGRTDRDFYIGTLNL